jgi:hypothetical protein
VPIREVIEYAKQLINETLVEQGTAEQWQWFKEETQKEKVRQVAKNAVREQ